MPKARTSSKRKATEVAGAGPDEEADPGSSKDSNKGKAKSAKRKAKKA